MMDKVTRRQSDKPNGLAERGIYLLPNLFTSAALFAGGYAIVQAMNSKSSMNFFSSRWSRSKSRP